MAKFETARWITSCTDGHMGVWVRRNTKSCFCGSDREWFKVAGSTKETRESKGYRNCDARCTGAVGAECNCSCAGINHGIDHFSHNHQLALI